MTKKTLGYVELEWTCPACDRRNRGSVRKCESCGAQMPEDMEFELPAQQELDASAEAAAQVDAGPDIHCAYCGTRNPANATRCSQCGGALTEGAEREAGRVLGAHDTRPAPEVHCPYCGAANPATSTRCSSCGGALGRPEPKEKPGVATPPKRKRRTWLVVLVIAAALLCVGVVLLTLPRGSSESVGVVNRVGWRYAVALEGLRPVQYEAWRDEVPSGAQLGECGKRVRRTVADPVPGATEVCGTPYVVDTGTGKGKVVQDCEYQVTDNWCQYSLDEWRAIGSREVASGSDLSPGWISLELEENEREAERLEEYEVIFLIDDREYRYRPADLDEYRKYEPRSRWSVTTRGSVVAAVVGPSD